MRTFEPEPTTFRVPLRDHTVERLMAISRVVGRPPIEVLASLIEHALKDGDGDDVLAFQDELLAASKH